MRYLTEFVLVMALFVLVIINGPDVLAMEQRALFSPESSGVPTWLFLVFVTSPGIMAVSLTVVWMRYQRIFAQDEGIQHTRRQWFRQTLIVGAIFGPISQACLQGAVHFLTGLPTMWELIVLAALITGLASVAAYEAIRWRLAVLIKKGNRDWQPVYDWISAKPGEKDPDTGDDIGHLTQFMQEDPTEPKNDA